MPSRTRYLFDSDVLITSARLHYSPSYCQAFWDWLTAGHQAGIFFSIDKVKEELLDGDDDPLSQWIDTERLKDFFQTSLPSIGQWKVLSAFANDPVRNYKTSAKNKFLDVDKADAWLISHSAHNGDFVIVTNEVSRPEAKADIKLPDAAAWLGVKTIKLHDLLNKYAGHNFTLSNISTTSTAKNSAGLSNSTDLFGHAL